MEIELGWSRQATAERLIAGGRVVLAVASLAAIWADPAEPARHAATVYGICVAYLVYALAIGAVAWIYLRRLPRFGLITHLIDLPVFTLLLYFTDGPASPFFAYFVFAVLSATLRWRWAGAMLTMAAVLFAFVAVGLFLDLVQHRPEFEFNRFLIRSVYLVILAVLVGYLGAFEERLRGDISRIASWQRGTGDDAAMITNALSQAVAICNAPRAALLWEQDEEPWLQMELYEDAELRRERISPVHYRDAVTPELAGQAFLCADCTAQSPAVLANAGDGPRWAKLAPLSRALCAWLSTRAVLAAPLAGTGVSGWLFVLDHPRPTSDHLTLIVIVARQVAAELEQIVARRDVARSAGLNERMRLARDLHDGVLQALAGVGLQLQAIGRDAPAGSGTATRLAQLERLIVAEQRDLRFFIRSMRPAPIDPSRVSESLFTQLQELGERIAAHWSIAVSVSGIGTGDLISEPLAQEVYRLVQEALVNAARHAKARTASAEVALDDERVVITVTDDGRGFDFHGRRNLQALAESGQGPVSLRERIAALGGELEIDSTERGAHVTMTLSLRPAGSAAGPRA